MQESDKFVIKADIPGVKKEDIHITTEGDVLSFSVESSTEKEEEDPNKKYHRCVPLGSADDRFVLHIWDKEGLLQPMNRI